MSTQSNLDIVQQWMTLYNTDVHRMIEESYADTFRVVCPGLLEITDKKNFHEIEQHVLDAAPDRKFRIEDSITTGNKVIVECVLFGTDPHDGHTWHTPWCAILTLDNGQVVEDHSYIDATNWPGVPTMPTELVTVHTVGTAVGST